MSSKVKNRNFEKGNILEKKFFYLNRKYADVGWKKSGVTPCVIGSWKMRSSHATKSRGGARAGGGIHERH